MYRRSSQGLCLILVSVLATLVPGVPATARAPVVVAAGDIACPDHPCRSHRRTAALIAAIDPRAVLTLGDNQYPDGALADYRASYDPTWGRFKGRTFPSPGNHEYQTPGAVGYFRYFGARAHQGNGGNYRFDLGKWQLISINSGGQGLGDSALAWLRRGLARDRDRCELAYWHHPLFSSGHEHGGDHRARRLWKVLYRAGVDIVLNGHEHNYERFALLNPGGTPRRNGIRQFVVGTGGAGLYSLPNEGRRGSQRRIDDHHGVLRLDLKSRSYEWRFVAVGKRTLDSGRQRCHG